MLTARAKGLDIDLAAMQASDRLILEPMDAAELSPGEFSNLVRPASMAATVASWPSTVSTATRRRCRKSRFSPCTCTSCCSIETATFLTIAQHGMMGEMRQSIDVTYLADSVISFLERPFHPTTLVSVVETALRRRRQ